MFAEHIIPIDTVALIIVINIAVYTLTADIIDTAGGTIIEHQPSSVNDELVNHRS